MAFSLHRTAAGSLLPLAGRAAAGSRALVLPGKAAPGGVFAGKPAVTRSTRSAAPVVCAAWDSEHAAAYDGSSGENDKAILAELALKLAKHTASLLEEICTLKSCASEPVKLRQVHYELMELITGTSHDDDADHLVADLISLHTRIRISLCYGRLDTDDGDEHDDARLLRARWLPGSLESSPRLQDTLMDTLLFSMTRLRSAPRFIYLARRAGPASCLTEME